MKEKNFLKHFLVKFLTTGFFVSYLIPFLPSLWGVILGVILVYLTSSWFLIFRIFLFLIITLLAIPLSTEAEKILNKGKDPQVVIIDEVSAMLLLGLFFDFFKNIYIFNFKIPFFLIIIAIFGIFDGLEPLFIKRIEKLNGGWGIVLDDLVAGLYTTITLLIILYVFQIR